MWQKIGYKYLENRAEKLTHPFHIRRNPIDRVKTWRQIGPRARHVLRQCLMIISGIVLSSLARANFRWEAEPRVSISIEREGPRVCCCSSSSSSFSSSFSSKMQIENEKTTEGNKEKGRTEKRVGALWIRD